MPWKVELRHQGFYKGEGKRWYDPVLGSMTVVAHTDGRETSRALFQYLHATVWRDMEFARKAVLNGTPELDKGWQKMVDNDVRDWYEEAYAIADSMNIADEKAVKSGKAPKYPVDVFPAAKQFRWFAEADGFLTHEEFDSSQNVQFREIDRKSKGLAVFECLDENDWKVANERFRKDWLNRMPLNADELLKAAIEDRARLQQEVELESQQSIKMLYSNIAGLVGKLESHNSKYGESEDLTKALKLANSLKKLFGQINGR